METKKRLIDANALESQFRATKIIEVFPEWENLSFQTKHKLVRYGNTVKMFVQNAPTVDAVEVVRCKDCKCGKHPESTVLVGKYVNCALYDPMPIMRPDDFCSYGERRTK